MKVVEIDIATKKAETGAEAEDAFEVAVEEIGDEGERLRKS